MFDHCEEQHTDVSITPLQCLLAQVPSELYGHPKISKFNGTIGREEDIATYGA